MDASDVVKGRAAGTERDQPGPEPRCLERDNDVREPVRGIGMPRRRLVVQEDLIVDETDSVHKDFTLTMISSLSYSFICTDLDTSRAGEDAVPLTNRTRTATLKS
jgi:hypothetical protein